MDNEKTIETIETIENVEKTKTTIDLITDSNYIILNKNFARVYGLETAVVLGAMCGYQVGFKGEFYRQQTEIMEDTMLSQYAVRSAVKNLVALKILQVSKHGLPAKTYYRVDISTLETILSDCKHNKSMDLKLGVKNVKLRDNKNGTSRDNKNGTSRHYENNTSRDSENIITSDNENATSRDNENATANNNNIYNNKNNNNLIISSAYTNKYNNPTKPNLTTQSYSNLEIENKRECMEVVDAYNQICKSYAPIKLDKNNSILINKLLKSVNGIDDIIQAFNKIENSNFLKGDNKFKFKANFGWSVKIDNFGKIYSGYYDNDFNNNKLTQTSVVKGNGRLSIMDIEDNDLVNAFPSLDDIVL